MQQVHKHFMDTTGIYVYVYANKQLLLLLLLLQ